MLSVAGYLEPERLFPAGICANLQCPCNPTAITQLLCTCEIKSRCRLESCKARAYPHLRCLLKLSVLLRGLQGGASCS